MGNKEILVGLSVALMGSAAHAGVIYSLEDAGILTTQLAGANTVNFNDGTCGVYTECNATGGLVTGSASGQYATPYGINDRYLTVSHGSASLWLDETYDYFGLYWGSVDAYNHISFYLGEVLVGTFSGDELAPLAANGDQTSHNSNRFVNFFFDDGDVFDRVSVSSSGYAFESDNHAFARTGAVSVPEPGTLALLGAGLIPLVWRRKRAEPRA